MCNVAKVGQKAYPDLAFQPLAGPQLSDQIDRTSKRL